MVKPHPIVGLQSLPGADMYGTPSSVAAAYAQLPPPPMIG